MRVHTRNHITHILGAFLVMAALVGLACGTAATPTALPVARPAPVPASGGVATPAIPVTAPAPAPQPAPQPIKVARLVFASTAVAVETNRVWLANQSGTIPSAFAETLIDRDPGTGALVPLLADKWESSLDGKSWTFFLHNEVPFHFSFGDFTAKDVIHTHSLMTREDSVSASAGFWRTAETLEAVTDHQLVFRMRGPTTTVPFQVSRSGNLVIFSKAQWDREGVGGIDRRPAGTGSYQYVERRLGQSILFARAENHWRGERPDFKELEIRWVTEDSTRLAMLLTGEAHMADLPRGLQDQAVKKGMKIIASQLAPVGLLVQFGGQYHIKGDPKFKPEVPWNDKRVRQAMNMAINRKELLNTIFKGGGTPAQVQSYHPVAHRREGWNPEWEKRFDEMYGYNPTKARALLEQAGYAPGTIKVKGAVFPFVGVPELPQVMEAMQIYFHKVGIQMELEQFDFAPYGELRRKKETHCCIAPGAPGLGEIEERLRIWNTSKGSIHSFQDDFIEEKYLALTKALDPKERERLAREIGDHLFENFSSIPLAWLFYEVAVNPKVVAEWTFPGNTWDRLSHWALLKAAN